MNSVAASHRPISTYSIVARDNSGALGVAVQSHWYNVGAVVPWIEANVGAAAVQSISPPTAGPDLLDRLRSGDSAGSALKAALQGDPDQAYRQIAVIDRHGEAAVHTGNLCIAEAGHTVGEGFSAQANMMAKPTVWPAMAGAFREATGDLAERLLSALEAADSQGGDIRGRQSAAIVLEPANPSDGRFDLRVEDSPKPLNELRRLVELQRAYIELNRGDAKMAEGAIEEALGAYERATHIVPDTATGGEAAFWTGVALASVAKEEEAIEYLARAAAISDRWAELLPRLVASRMLPDDENLVRRLLRAMRA